MENRQYKETRFWNWFADKYDLFIKKTQSKIYQLILENIDLELNINFRVLEIGTGTGIVPFHICSKVSSITATDISSEMIKIAKQKQKNLNIKNIDFQVQDSYNLTLPDNSFDLVIANNVLHLLFEPEQALNEVKRVMKDNAFFIAPTFCLGENPKSRMISKLVGFLSGFKVVNQWTFDDFKSSIKNNGFSIEKALQVHGRFPLSFLVLKKII